LKKTPANFGPAWATASTAHGQGKNIPFASPFNPPLGPAGFLFLNIRPSQIALPSANGYNWGMSQFSKFYKKPFFACVFCIIYSAVSFAVALFGY
jgi:hypothetical protein